MKNIRSTRQLEAACREHLSLVWLTGRQAPDHNTLWRFFTEHGEALRRVCKRMVRIAAKADLVGFVLHAIDGTKIQARGSKRRLWEQEGLEQTLAVLEESVEQFLSETAAAGAGEGAGYRLPEQWQDAVRRREQLRELLDQLTVEERKHIHEEEREARMIQTRQGVQLAYNAQAVVDARSGLVVAETVVPDENDSAQLVPMLDAVVETVGRPADETATDGSYFSPAQLTAAAARGYEVVVAPGRHRAPRGPGAEFHRSRFTYDSTTDCCYCPRGGVLRFETAKPRRPEHDAVRVYRCRQAAQCPVRWACSRDPRGRTVEVSEHEPALARQRAKYADPAKRAVLRQRAGIIEPVFGSIKDGACGFRRWTVAGLAKVRVQWALVCAGHNLRKLYRFWRAGTLRLAA